MAKIKIKRGALITIPALDPGELAFTTDTKKIYIGTDSGNYIPADMMQSVYDTDADGVVNDSDKLDGLHAASASTASTVVARDSSGNVTAKTLISDVADGTTPLTVTSTTKVTNLNADMVDGLHAANVSTVSTIAARNASGNLLANVLVSDVAVGTAPLTVTSTTKVTNLNADMVDDLHVASASTASTIASRDSSGNITAKSLISDIAQGTAPLSVTSTTVNTNLNADLHDGYHASNATGAIPISNGTVNTNLNADMLDGLHSATASTASTVTARDASGNITAKSLISDVAIGTAPLTVTSTTKVANLNADMVDDLNVATASTASTIVARDASGNITGKSLVSDVTNGTAPLTVTSTTKVTNLNVDQVDGYHVANTSGAIPISNSTVNTDLNADLLDGYHAANTTGAIPISNGTVNTNLNADMVDGLHTATASTVSTVTARDASGNITAKSLISDVAIGTAPLTVTSTTKVTNLNVDALDGYHAANTTGAIPISNGTVNTNLNADMLDGLHTATASTASTVVARDASGNITGKSLVSDVAQGTAPLTVTSTTKVTNLNADQLDGLNSSDFATAAQGTLATNALPKGGGTMTGTLVLAADPANALEAATKQYVDAVAAGLNVHTSVEYATTVALGMVAAGSKVGKTLTAAANGIVLIDNAGLAVGNRILVKDEPSTYLDNGIYTVTQVGDATHKLILTRATDFDGTPSTEVDGGDFTFVTGGDTNANNGFVVIGNGIKDVDVVGIQWSQYTGAGTIINGTGIAKVGNTISLASGVIGTPGTYKSVTVDTYGRVTAGSNPTTLGGYGITDAATSAQGTLADNAVPKGGGTMTGNLTAPAFISNIAQGTAPMTVTSTTKVTNLNADLVDGLHTATGSTVSTVVARDASGNITGKILISDIADGTAPLTVISTTKVANLNADMLDGYTAANTTGSIPISNGTVNTNLNADMLEGLHATSASTASTVVSRDVSGNVTAKSLISDVAIGTAPLTVTSTTKVTNLNVDQVDGYHVANTSGAIPISNGTVNTNLNADMLDGLHSATASTVSTVAARDASGNVTAKVLVSDIAQGTAPLTVTSTTKVANLNADLLDDLSATSASTASTIVARDVSGNVIAKTLVSDVAQGTAPVTVTSTTVATNLNADLHDGYHAANTAGAIPISNTTLNTNLNADMVDGLHTATASTVSTVAARDASGNITAKSLISDVAIGTAPLTVTSTTAVTNLNADLHDGYHAANTSGAIPISNGTLNTNLNSDMLEGLHSATASTVSTVAARDASGNLTAKSLISDVAQGTAPLTVTSTTVVNNLNADMLGGRHLPELDQYNMYRSAIDANSIFTQVDYKRYDNTLFIRSILSGGTSPSYTTRTVTYYDLNGSTVLYTKVYTISYDGNGNITSEVAA